MLRKGDRIRFADARKFDEAASALANQAYGSPGMIGSNNPSGSFLSPKLTLEDEVPVSRRVTSAFVGRIMPNGPQGSDQPDYTDARYWVIEVSENSASNMTPFDRMSFYGSPTAAQGFRYVTATNLAELQGSSTANGTHNFKVLASDAPASYPIVHVFQACAPDGTPRFVFNKTATDISTIALFRLQAPTNGLIVGDSWLRAVRVEQNGSSSDYTYICKPLELCEKASPHPLYGASFTGTDYVWRNDYQQRRFFSLDAEVDETQVINPPYLGNTNPVVGPVSQVLWFIIAARLPALNQLTIFGVKQPSGAAFEWIDLNIAGRKWQEKRE